MSLPALAESSEASCPRCGRPLLTAVVNNRHQPLLPFDALAADDPHQPGALGRTVTARADLPDPVPTAHRLVQALLEVLAGDRPARQLAGCTSELLLHNIEARVSTGRHRPWVGSVRSVHVSEPRDGVAEVSAVVAMGAGARAGAQARCRAVALRLEGLDGRWRMTALLVG